MTGFQLVRDHLDFVLSMVAEVLPATILIGPAIVLVWRRRRDRQHDPMLAATLYSLMCTLFLVIWPGGVAARYAMPATMTLAVICGLMFEHWRQSQPRVIVSALVVSYLIFGALLVRGSVVMPFWQHLFQESQIAGKTIDTALQHRPGPLYVIGNSTEHNMLVYVRGTIRAVTLDDLARLETSAIAVMLPEEEATLGQQNPRMRLIDHANIVSQRRPYRIVEIQACRGRRQLPLLWMLAVLDLDPVRLPAGPQSEPVACADKPDIGPQFMELEPTALEADFSSHPLISLD